LTACLAVGDVVLEVDGQAPLVIEVAVQRGERTSGVELEPLHLGEADDVRDGAGLEGGGELLVEIRVGAHGLGDRDDLVLRLVELGEQGGELRVEVVGEGCPEEDRGAALVLGGDGEVRLGEAVADGAAVIRCAAGCAAGCEARCAGAEAERGEDIAAGGGEGGAGHGFAPWSAGRVVQVRGGRDGAKGPADGWGPTSGRRPSAVTSWRRRRVRR